MGVAFETDNGHPKPSLTDQTKPDMPNAESRITPDAQNGAHAHKRPSGRNQRQNGK